MQGQQFSHLLFNADLEVVDLTISLPHHLRDRLVLVQDGAHGHADQFFGLSSHGHEASLKTVELRMKMAWAIAFDVHPNRPVT